MPAEKSVGDDVFAATVNGNGAIEVRVTRLAADTTLAKIIQMVEQAQTSKAPTQRFLDEFEPKYALGVVIFTILHTGASQKVALRPGASGSVVRCSAWSSSETERNVLTAIVREKSS